jgi:molybdate transport system ATP-binding protein
MSAGLVAQLTARVGSLEIDAALDTGTGTLILVGPNGAGKSSLLSLLLGVLPARTARITLAEQVLVDTTRGIALPTEARRLGYVPQDYALFPHMTVRENVAFAVQCAGARGADIHARATAALHKLGIQALAERPTPTLSGGEKQRVALARALSVEPRALLLDEPLAALDIHARREVRALLAETLQQLALPTLIITHDPVDARELGTTIAVLETGKITQVGSWSELVAQPASAFVGEFVQAG